MLVYKKPITKVKGFNVKEKAKKRTAFKNYKGFNLNTQRETSAETLRKKKLAMLESREINAGELVVAVEYYVTTIQSDGLMVNTAHIASSRNIFYFLSNLEINR